jgi:hypothetical protein
LVRGDKADLKEMMSKVLFLPAAMYKAPVFADTLRFNYKDMIQAATKMVQRGRETSGRKNQQVAMKTQR